MCSKNQVNEHLNSTCRLHTVDLTVDPIGGWLESIEAAVAVETAAEVAVGTADGTAAAAGAVELAAVEKEKHLGLAGHRRWPWESFPPLPELDSVAFHLF